MPTSQDTRPAVQSIKQNFTTNQLSAEGRSAAEGKVGEVLVGKGRGRKARGREWSVAVLGGTVGAVGVGGS